MRSPAALSAPPKSPASSATSRRRSTLLVAAFVAVVVAGIVLRFWTRSDLWLDEALSVDIARLPLGKISGALRHDGHPPLYYYLLHLWMQAFGESDIAVRALSGVFAVATLPLAWRAGRRYAGRDGAVAAVVILSMLPFAMRYATETRMYSLVTLLVFAGWLCVRRAFERPRFLTLASLTLISGALLLTHYWSFYLLGAVAAWLTVTAWRGSRRREAALVLVAVAAGAVFFVPWLPVFLYQSAHTGTPWATPSRPAAMLMTSLEDLGGGGYGEAQLLGLLVAFLLALGLFARRVDRHRVELDLRTRPEARPEAWVLAGTFALAAVGSYATRSAFASRYIALLVPFVILLAALGITRLPSGVPRSSVLGLIVVLGLAGGAHNVVTQRTQGGEIGRALAAHMAPGDVVAFCPDQLGPAVARHLPGGADAVTFPDAGDPHFVDWADYAERNRAADPEAFARQVLARAGGHDVWLVWSSGYRTLDQKCGDLQLALGHARPAERVVAEADTFEHAELVHYPAT